MSDAYTPIRGKCTWWRELDDDEDQWDVRLKEFERRVHCSCFVEGKAWTWARQDLPADCPEYRHCRYYIKNV